MTPGGTLRVLHLLSDWKWTGPAEPAVDLAEALARRGHHVLFACESPPHAVDDWVGDRARARGLTVLTELRLKKHFSIASNFRDLWRIPGLLAEHRVEVVHCHRGQDHLVAGVAVRRRRLPVAVVRTSFEGGPLRRTIRNRYLLGRCTTRLVDISRRAAEADRAAFGLGERAVVVEPPVDLVRFDPSRPGRDLRPALGLSADAIVAGIVARVQRRRRWDVLLEAFRRASREEPRLRLLIVGRGTHQDEVARAPARAMGLADRVVFAGYRKDDFVDVVRTFDLGVFLVPGTDGSCRAVRQAMALGIPHVVSRRGVLPEIVEDGRTGLVTDDEPEPLAAALLRLARDAALRSRLGALAGAEAVRRWDPARQAEAIEEVYRSALAEVGGHGS